MSGVKVVFLGRLADLAGLAEQDFAAPLNWPALIAALPPTVSDELTSERVHLAVNGEVLVDKTALHAQDGDEVALLPPVSGG